MLEQLEIRDETHQEPVAFGFWVKKEKISGISSPKLTLCRTENTTNLVFLL